MIIREATSDDKPAIVELLKSSLGEGFVKKSETVWDFKHHQNPFGTSEVLLAFENEQLIGVRAFMQWRWQLKDTTWIAYRAVDTATHPEHQGKGIFKKLTLEALEIVKLKSETFIFNTPNDKSRPGYLKMGWQVVDAIPIALVPTVLYSLTAFFSKKAANQNQIHTDRLDEICVIHNHNMSKKSVIFTPKSAAYLRWRFEQNPLQHYFVISTKDWYVALYVKKHKFYKELRVAEIISPNTNVDAIRKVIVQQAMKNRCFLITVADKNIFRLRIFGKFGPKLTFKPITEDTEFINKALSINSWGYSLGDLELF
ncbi:GNAT family N-acetyltransferase [Flavobacterium sp. AS60]|uniref:GNAT family N-acetyltransferase n=1 Tax=Flavobacterium anseongense TaxID=2910677 RepID=UPI001F21D9FE|nr:GNAT family N-acetyltransferase [Flavobacterium sp. AS60]MCF6129896.1 GNAT family N-acetyltransferase [Flavobacterium sp. AS60]